jgi:hypothetical protein
MKNEKVALQEQLDGQRLKVDVDHYDLTVREIVRMAIEKELLYAPEYQRRFRWGAIDESRLIESLYLGLPVPSIFVATNPDGTWELVDGLQRVSTLIHYTCPDEDIRRLVDRDKPLVLTGLETLTDFIDTTYEKLPAPLQLAFSRRLIRVTALSDKSDYTVRFDLFDRLNRGGIALSPQEIRACTFRGKFWDLLKELASTPEFWGILKLQPKKQSDGTPEELVLKFFAYLYGRNTFKGEVTSFLNQYMAEASKSFDFEPNRKLFHQVVHALVSALAGRQFLRRNSGVTPLNQLEAVMVAIAHIILSNAPLVDPPNDWLNDEELVKNSSEGTNSPSSLRGRIGRAIELFSGKRAAEIFAFHDVK